MRCDAGGAIFTEQPGAKLTVTDSVFRANIIPKVPDPPDQSTTLPLTP